MYSDNRTLTLYRKDIMASTKSVNSQSNFSKHQGGLFRPAWESRHTFSSKMSAFHQDTIGAFNRDQPGGKEELFLKEEPALEGQELEVAFSLKYLPRYITREDVNEKLKKFGKLSYFDYRLEADESMGAKRGPNSLFRRAIFSYYSREVNFSFANISRIRIKGLQIKVVQEDPTVIMGLGAETHNIEPCTTDCKVKEDEVDHEVRPTSKGYLRIAPELHPSSSDLKLRSNYVWRYASPLV